MKFNMDNAQMRGTAMVAGTYAKAKRKKARHSGDVDLAIIICPHCGKKHTHGWGTGYRSPHCTDGAMRARGDYFVDCGDE